jgi:Helix-loop-helix DNA-binding domain
VLRKSSHKAAEQKRRDSLKTTFDDLRTLLPPIPLPTEEGYPDEPILPGAMPPRGPPRGNAGGPNRGISKLQLLRCGNDYIRILNEKISRRDNEISLLRSEIRRLRGLMNEDVWQEDANDIDLERNVDDGELGPWRRSAGPYDADDMEEEAAE